MYRPTRHVMTRAELDEHKTAVYGRDYNESDDGYSDMEAETGRGWYVISGWGRDGWDLGDWPYVMIYSRDRGERFDLMQVVEGDRTVWTFASDADRDAAIDYLFLWYAAGERWSPFPGQEGREALDRGAVNVDNKFRGPFSWARADEERD